MIVQRNNTIRTIRENNKGIEMEEIKNKRKPKKSILDPYKDRIEYLVKLGITVPNITKLMNEEVPVKLSETAYRHFIQKNFKTQS